MPAEPTPGTWRLGDPELCEIYAGDELIAIVYPRRADKGKPASETERRANLYLMLAAKEMRDALGDMVERAQINGWTTSHRSFEERKHIKAARAALAHSRGEGVA